MLTLCFRPGNRVIDTGWRARYLLKESFLSIVDCWKVACSKIIASRGTGQGRWKTTSSDLSRSQLIFGLFARRGTRMTYPEYGALFDDSSKSGNSTCYRNHQVERDIQLKTARLH